MDRERDDLSGTNIKHIAMVVLSQYPGDPRVRREAEALERAGVAVDVLCLRGESESEVEQFGRVTAYRVMKRSDNKESLPAYVWHTLCFISVVWFAFLRLSRRHRYRLLQVHNMPDYLVFIGFWQKLWGLPIVLDLHDLTVELFASRWNSRKSRLLLPVVRFLEKISCCFADHLITTSNGFRDCLIRRGIPSEKITLVLNSADHTIFQSPKPLPEKREEKCRILYHGTVKERFGIHVVIEAMPQVRQALPEATLTIIHGAFDPAYRVELEEKIASLGLQECVQLEKFRPLEEIVKFIHESDIGIVPYMSDIFMDIALSTKSFEYVAMGLPVVASRLPSITSLFDEECVAYFEAGNAEDCANQLVQLHRDTERKRRHVKNALLAYQEIAWPIMEKRYVDLINRAMRKSESGVK